MTELAMCICGYQPLLWPGNGWWGVKCPVCLRQTEPWLEQHDAIVYWNRRTLEDRRLQQNLPPPANSTSSSGSTPD